MNFPNYRALEMAEDSRKLGTAVGYALAEQEDEASTRGAENTIRQDVANSTASKLADMYPHPDVRRAYLDGIQEGRQTWIHGLFLDGTGRTEAGRQMVVDLQEGAMRCCEWVE